MKVSPTLLLLTYLAQVRQLPFRSAWLCLRRVSTTHPILLTQLSKKHGTLRKAIVIIGIVPDAAWVGRNRNMQEWSKVVGNWHQRINFISSQSHAEERK